MKPTDSGTQNRDAQQRTNNHQQTPVQGPEAASKRDVEEAKRKADNADQRADDAKRMAVEETQKVRQVVEELEETVEQTREELTVLDQVVNGLFENAASPEGEPPLNSDMPHCCKENREDDLPVEEAMKQAAEEAGSDD